jgi:hypothetical protein
VRLAIRSVGPWIGGDAQQPSGSVEATSVEDRAPGRPERLRFRGRVGHCAQIAAMALGGPLSKVEPAITALS